jgi:hypothetical protein
MSSQPQYRVVFPTRMSSDALTLIVNMANINRYMVVMSRAMDGCQVGGDSVCRLIDARNIGRRSKYCLLPIRILKRQPDLVVSSWYAHVASRRPCL